MTNTEIFEEIFWQVGEENNLNHWYEIFDSEIFHEVERRIAERFCAVDPYFVPEYEKWVNGMTEEL